MPFQKPILTEINISQRFLSLRNYIWPYEALDIPNSVVNHHKWIPCFKAIIYRKSWRESSTLFKKINIQYLILIMYIRSDWTKA